MSLISPLSIAPMIDWTNTHFRVFMRLIAPKALLYTEMQTCGAIQYNEKRALGYNQIEHPLALQLGGSNPEELASCTKKAEQLGYAEVNLNLGCPSDRVQSGRFGACLMAEPELASTCLKAMKDSVSIPVTAKVRIGIDHQDSYEFFERFVNQLLEAGCDKIIVHARKAWLNGLSPKQNRTIPPINYEYVFRLKKSYPEHPIVINGNINSLEEIQALLPHIDGVMLGRLACNNPYAIGAIHQHFYPTIPIQSHEEIIESYVNYLDSQYQVPLSVLLKPLFNFYHGLLGSKQWKHQLMTVQQMKSRPSLKDLRTVLLGI